jgi:hypothetical protein
MFCRQERGIRPLVVFLDDQASPECKTWGAQWEPLFIQADG